MTKKRKNDDPTDDTSEYVPSESDTDNDYPYPPKKHKKLLNICKKIRICMCPNKNCNHKLAKNEVEWNAEHPVNITEIKTVKDFIKLADLHHCKMRPTYNGINLELIVRIKDSLIELDGMIGLTKIKEEIVSNIKAFLSRKTISKNNMLHSVITGSAGCGKTTFIEILAKIYKNIGILKKGHVVKANRANLIGEYCGHTAIKTMDRIKEAYGGIFLLDEAYQLGHAEHADCFSKECVDTINQQLSEIVTDDEIQYDYKTGEEITKEDRFFICFIAGYKDALEKDFFSQNQGLMRRFPFRYDIEPYTASELSQILLKKIKETHPFEFDFEIKDLNELISKNFKYFKNQGGDMQSLYLKIVISQIDRTFLLREDEKNKLKIDDIKNAVNSMLENIKKTEWTPPFGMYV